jgi:hypothetical protein
MSTNKEGFNTQNYNITTVRNEYNKTLTEYKNLLNSISNSISKNVDRVSPSNPYLNKYIRFQSGEIYYVNNKGVAKKIKSTSILNSVAGKNGCPDINYLDINIPWSTNYNIPGQEIPTNPPLVVGTDVKKGQSCGYEGSNVYVNSMINHTQLNYKGCFQDNSENSSMNFIGNLPGDGNGTYNFDQCKEAAIDRGYKYFALQNADPNTGLGYCATTNRLNKSTKYGKSYKSIPIWMSNTSGKPVSYAILTKNGTLSVLDSNGISYFTTPNGTNCQQVYSKSDGVDAPGNDLGYYSNQTVSSCQELCSSNQNCNGIALDTNNNSSCWLKSGDLSNIVNNNQRALYKKTVNTKDCNYFLLLQNDGNMCIYKGIPNTENVTNIWCSNTNGSQQEPNENYINSSSKYGTSFLKDMQILNKGDWICNENGTLALIMQEDGNLVLYAFQTNCSKNSDNKYYGGELANPIYDIGSKGVISNMGLLGYIDPNSDLHKYPMSNVKYADKYSSVLENTNIMKHDIMGASFANCSNVEDCMNACNNLNNCSGFVYDTTGPTPVCNPKKTNLFKKTDNMQSKMGTTTYVRDKTIIQPANGIDNIINNVNSIRYNNYKKYRKNNLNFDVTSLNSVQKSQLEQLESKLEQLSEQLKGYTDNLSTLNTDLNLKTQKRSQKFYDNIKNIDTTNKKIKRFDTHNNIDNILKETEIKTLQENYGYMFWSIISIATVLIAINIKKND